MIVNIFETQATKFLDYKLLADFCDLNWELGKSVTVRNKLLTVSVNSEYDDF